MLAGTIPVRQLKMVIGWLALYEEEVYGEWNNAVRGIAFEKIRFIERRHFMRIVDGIAYAEEVMEFLEVESAKTLDDCVI